MVEFYVGLILFTILFLNNKYGNQLADFHYKITYYNSVNVKLDVKFSYLKFILINN